MVYDVYEWERKAEFLTPMIAFALILLIFSVVIFFVPAMNTYGNRIALFWYYFNGLLLAKIYSIYLTNARPDHNMYHWMCED